MKPPGRLDRFAERPGDAGRAVRAPEHVEQTLDDGLIVFHHQNMGLGRFHPTAFH